MSTPDNANELYPNVKDDSTFETLASPSYESAVPATEDTPVYQDPVDRDRQIQEWKDDLAKVEGEIATLRQVLGSKIHQAGELKQKLGITPFQEFRHDLRTGIQQIKGSGTYQKTNQKLSDFNESISQSTAYQKTTSVMKSATEKTGAAFTSLGSSVTKKLGDLRNSQTFKSMETKVGETYNNVKRSPSIDFFMAKVAGSKSETSFEDALKTETETGNGPNDTDTSSSLPEEKMPL